MLRATLNEAIPLQVQVTDGNTVLYARALVYEPSGGLEETFNLTHLVQGLYGTEHTFTAEGFYTVVYLLYSDSGYTSLATDYDIQAELVEVNSDKTNIIKLLGLNHDNTVVDQQTYDLQGNLLSCRIRYYDSKANAEAAGTAGLLHTWTSTGTYTNERLDLYKVVREP
jgi:hypothetical protein